MQIRAHLRKQAGVAERYTRLSQKQVPQGLRVRISPPAYPIYCYPQVSIPRSNSCRLSTEIAKNLLPSFGFAVSFAVKIKRQHTALEGICTCFPPLNADKKTCNGEETTASHVTGFLLLFCLPRKTGSCHVRIGFHSMQ
jgi:hypothetical protein